MRKDEVPQEGNRTQGGERKAVYALGEDGDYVVIPSPGSSMEETVTTQALEEYRRLGEDARQRHARGEASLLEVHMYARRMDRETLAQSVGMARWRVRRHLRPHVFAKLKPSLLDRYADALGLSRDELLALPCEEHAAQ